MIVTQAELAEILDILRELQRLGWPVIAWPPSPLVLLDVGLTPQRRAEWNEYFPESFEAEVRNWLEQQVDARGLWREYLMALVAERDALTRNDEEGYSWYILSKARPTLLEVARAALAVAREAENG